MATSLQAQFRRRPYYKDLSIGHLKRHDAAIAIVAALLLMSCACHLTNEVTAERIVPARSVPAQGMEPGYKKSRSNASRKPSISICAPATPCSWDWAISAA